VGASFTRVARGGDPAVPPPVSSAGDKGEGLERLKQERRIVMETNVPPDQPSGAAASKKESSFNWYFRWEGWNGLHVGISQKTPLEDPGAELRARLQGTNAVRIFNLEELKMNGKIGAKFALDGAGYVTSGQLQNFDGGFELRRARIYAKGDCLLILPVSYQLELGYIPQEFYIEESYLSFKNIKWIGELKLGQYQAPMGLDVISSSRDITFMEPAAPLQALAPGVNAGLQMGQPVFDNRATWTLGMFTDGLGNDFGDASKDYGRAIVRFTGLPIYQPDADDPGSARLLHLGLSANVLFSSDSTVRYQARPESHMAPYVVDTGDLSSQGALVLGAEIAWVNGPFTVQGEFLHSFVDQSDAPALNFQGFYASAGWFLTGDSHPYDLAQGAFGRVIPKHNFDWGKGGWGAWEIVGRYSFVDLNDGDINGGRLGMVMAGVNWYLHSNVKWRFDYGFGHVTDHTPDGNLNVFQTRLEVDF
jgi:phosphate-selective porin OprO/OprP